MATDKKDLFPAFWRVIANANLDNPFPFVGEYQFAKKAIGRKWAFDFADPDHKLAVEVDGNAWHVKGGGGHMKDNDLEKLNTAVLMGWRVLRFSPGMLKRDPEKCIKLVVACLERKE